MKRKFSGEIVSKGAEAVLIKGKWYGIGVLKKIRMRKKYRHEVLDFFLRRKRTIKEAKILLKAKMLGIACPTVLDIDVENSVIVMDYIVGERVKDVIRTRDVAFLKKIFRDLGEEVGILHKNGIVHGDLTTSNMILVQDKIFLIDFGLGEFSNSIEDMGVDIHLFLRSLESFHNEFKDILFQSFLQGYEKIVGKTFKEKIIAKIKDIRSRGRYIDRELRKSIK